VTSVLRAALASSIAALAYVYAGYPLLLRLVVRLRGARRVETRDITPSLSLLISAHNEEAVIGAKLENALALDYPREQLAIVVVSDASNDRTDAIVGEYAARGVTLVRREQRGGKTAGLNYAVPRLTSELVVFSDANAMYQPDALRKLARNFADPTVGCVTGEARYLPDGQAAADVGERAYWNYEIQIKRLETAVGSMVGGDGAIYAIRRSLWRTLPDNAINDFLNPLQIVAAGWRTVYEPEAICWEETAGRTGAEYRRRVRIVSRSWRAVFEARGVLNPARVGLFAWSLVSHKLMRWVSPLFSAVAVAAGVVLVATTVPATGPALGVAAVILAAAAATPRGRRLMGIGAYFAVISAESLVGVIKGITGRVSGVWSTPREQSGTRTLPVGRAFLAVAAMLAVAAAVAAATSSHAMAKAVFWWSTGVLVYIYAGYPAVLAVLRTAVRRRPRLAPIEPRVSLFITANDEAGIIEAKLRNALELDYPADCLDILVASDGSVDATNAIVARFGPRVRLLAFTRRRGKIATINDGLHAVTSDIVVFSDANTFLEPDALRALVRNFADPDVGAVSGDVALIGDRAALAQSEDLYYRYERWVQHAESDVGSLIGADGALYAIRRQLFTPPPADTILDDMAIPMAVIRAGRRVVFEPQARAWEQGSQTAREEFNRKARVVAGAMQFLTRRDSDVPLRDGQVMVSLVSHKALRWLSPVFATCTLLATVALLDVSHTYVIAAAVQAGVLAIGLAGCVPTLRRVSPVGIIHYFCLVQAAAAVGFLRGLTRRQSVLWQRVARVAPGEPCRS
jgi:cellulose synthase/poly-beta-1,6-N-acetylglucosamine synthase-like glycosyltransferase